MRLGYAVIAAGGLLTLASASAASLNVSSEDLTAIRTCILTGYSTPQTESDVKVVEANPSRNYANKSHIEVKTATDGAVMSSYIQFVLSSCRPAIPTTAVIESATLLLYLASVPSTTTGLPCRTEDVYAVTESWTASGVTWANQPTTAAAATDSMTLGTRCSSNSTTGYVSGWTVTSDVQDYVSHPSNTAYGNGWLLADTAPTSASTTTEYTDYYQASASQAPQLVITYSEQT